MPVFSRSYNTGLVAGLALGGVISLWWYNRDSVYHRVKATVGPTAAANAAGEGKHH